MTYSTVKQINVADIFGPTKQLLIQNHRVTTSRKENRSCRHYSSTISTSTFQHHQITSAQSNTVTTKRYQKTIQSNLRKLNMMCLSMVLISVVHVCACVCVRVCICACVHTSRKTFCLTLLIEKRQFHPPLFHAVEMVYDSVIQYTLTFLCSPRLPS